MLLDVQLAAAAALPARSPIPEMHRRQQPSRVTAWPGPGAVAATRRRCLRALQGSCRAVRASAPARHQLQLVLEALTGARAPRRRWWGMRWGC